MADATVAPSSSASFGRSAAVAAAGPGPTSAVAASGGTTFTLVVHGTIDCAECLDAGLLYCKSLLVKGRDWSLASNSVERANTIDVITQTSERLPGPIAKFTWNAPFEFVLQSTNLFGWPQMAFCLTTISPDGKDTVVAYSRCSIPMSNGVVRLDLPLMRPEYSQLQNREFGFFQGTPELRDPALLCSTEDRVVLTARRLPGYIRVTFNVTVTGFAALGFD